MNQISVLVSVPPTERLRVHAGRLQRGQGLLGLNLRPAMRQQEGHREVDKDFHGRLTVRKD